MAKPGKAKVSAETIASAERIAKATQRPGQSKEQTKLISQGIQKGIELYKKQHKAKMREADKQRKKQQTSVPAFDDAEPGTEQPQPRASWQPLPWVLLVLSWLGFAVYLFSNIGQ